MALAITDATFDEVVLKSEQPVLVDFWAAWCSPMQEALPNTSG
jgi:thioredoxin 1